MNAQTQRGPPTEDEDRNPPVHARDGPEQVVELSLTELYPFKNHPFHVVDDVHMESTAQSIKSNGVLVPVIVRPRAEASVFIFCTIPPLPASSQRLLRVGSAAEQVHHRPR